MGKGFDEVDKVLTKLMKGDKMKEPIEIKKPTLDDVEIDWEMSGF